MRFGTATPASSAASHPDKGDQRYAYQIGLSVGKLKGKGEDGQLEDRPGENCGDRVGPYKLLRQIGEGGCGIVYMAEQEEPVRRRVALKVISLAWTRSTSTIFFSPMPRLPAKLVSRVHLRG
jgi:hypothetical protein